MIRDDLISRLATDLLGPADPSEILDARPSDCYLTGILFPPRTKIAEEENEQLGGGVNEDDAVGDENAGAGGVALALTQRQASAGLSFAACSETGAPSISFEVFCGVYRRVWTDPETNATSAEQRHGQRPRWQRIHRQAVVPSFVLQEGLLDPIPLATADGEGISGLTLRIRTAWSGNVMLVTAILVNEHPPCESRAETEEASFFQVELVATSGTGTRLVERPARRSGEDPSDALIYRSAAEYAVGHTCSAAWTLEGEAVTKVRTTWLPTQVVPAVSPEGDAVFARLSADAALKPRSAAWLSSAPASALLPALSMLPDAYEEWLRGQATSIPSLPAAHQEQATRHIAACRTVKWRMRDAVRLLAEERHTDFDPKALRAFQLANRAMALQREWTQRGRPGAAGRNLEWRPFQLGFQLLVIPSLTRGDHPHRETMDLLWFPTGGGKTEAYLGLIAFLLFYRRLRGDDPAQGAGVAVLMRYTLRLLTIQQFQRAATLISACEHIRRENAGELGGEACSLGLWVGSTATPNSVDDAVERIRGSSDSTPRQLTNCPVCQGSTLRWFSLHECRACGALVELDVSGCCKSCLLPPPQGKQHDPKQIRVECGNSTCEFGSSSEPRLPVWTVDEDIYRERPSLVIGTVDKFAQVARKRESLALFGDATRDAPDLILQDELHLISGPLGTVTALYEIAVDELCTRTAADGRKLRPKVIGSTATIRAATEQIRSLFDRNTCLFPPPMLDAESSCFARRDSSRPGRLYVGVTTAGRSPKFTLQAVYASLLQSSAGIGASEAIDPYWTLVGYFNSLRELGGALVMATDDVPATIHDLASRRGEGRRNVNAVDELTSRKTSSEIPEVLDRLGYPCTDSAVYDVILATNMLSVGVDIPRLGLMVVNGQPKQVAEYIQATSRVGREHPGLIVSVYNSGRARDRSYFETFSTWHSSLYRDVEATSVTPFAARAVDKALHAVLTVLVRHLISGMATTPNLTPVRRGQIESTVWPLILDRVCRIDPSERDAVRLHLRNLLDQWEQRCSQWAARAGSKPGYWKESSPEDSLLISAESYVSRVAAGMPGGDVWPTPNSMRDVEPGSPFKLISRLRINQGV
jgi:Helicase conserved C-terminal domain